MHFFKKTILFFAWAGSCCAADILADHRQLLVVTTRDWDSLQGEMALYERFDDASLWLCIEASIPVVVGKNGLAWGIGLHPMINGAAYKKESDLKSPAGIFSLGSAFGFASEMSSLKLNYLALNEFVEAIDDPSSRYYNCIVDRREVLPDWRTSEKMSEEPLHAMGLAVNHNFPNPKEGAGSAIFLHIWENENSGTAGCTAMNREDLTRILFWLDPKKNPALVQLPIQEYLKLQNKWSLPAY